MLLSMKMNDTGLYNSLSQFIELAIQADEHLDIDVFNNIILDILKYYKDENFRHKYSQISKMIHKAVNISVATIENISILESISNNFDLLYMYFLDNYKDKCPDSVEVKLNKLIDHITLEIVRLQYISQYNDTIVENTNLFNESSSKLTTAQEAINAANKHIQNMYAQIISILGIFAAIIIAFFGGFNYFTSVLNNIGNIEKFRLLSISSIIGFTVLNTIFGMLYFIGKLTDKNISVNCENDKEHIGCYKGCNNVSNCNNLKRFRRRMPYIFWVNVVLLIIMLCSTVGFIFWG